MDLVCFDTQIIIWGIKKDATPGQEDMIVKAEHLIQQCEEERIQIIVPAIVVAELLSGLKPESYSEFTAFMQRRFMVIPFDTQAALHFAVMWRNRKQSLIDAVTRTEMRTDYLIIATAKARGAKCIYSEDPHLSNFAQNYIEVKGLPSI
jgi:predicted nucleic acid-binding protein